MNRIVIDSFELNKKFDAKKNSEILIDFTKTFLKNNHLNTNLKCISKITDIPLNILEKECKHYLQYNFDNKKGKYNKRFFYLYSFFDFFKFLSFFLWILFFSKKENKNENFDLIIDDLDYQHSINLFNELSKYFSKTLIITTIKKYKNSDNYLFFDKYKSLNIRFNAEFLYNFFCYLPFNILKLSINSKNNLFGINLHILKIYFKYSSIFQNKKAKFLVQERYYRSSSLKNYLFKKFGGLSVSITQRVLPIYSSFGMFVDCDNFFSLGRRSAEIILNQDSSIGRVIPIGSLSMCQNYFNNNNINLNELKTYDLLDLESRMADSNDVYDDFWDDWYLKFHWLSKLSKSNPNLKIGIKIRPEHASMMNNSKIMDSIKNSNIKIIDGSEYSFKFNTYHYAFKAKSLCTWISTIGFEMLGHGKKCFFINPSLKNSSYKDFSILDKFTIDNYVSFEKSIINEINNFDNKFEDYEKEDYCLRSHNVFQELSKKIKASQIYENS